MFSSWGWLRNLGVLAMIAAVLLWFTAPSNTSAWIAALLLWLLGCVLVSAAGLAVLCRPQAQLTHKTTPQPKAKVAAA